MGVSVVGLSNRIAPQWAATFLAGFVALLAALLNFFQFNEYPLWTPEVFVTALGLFVVCTIAGAIYLGVRPLLQIFMDALLVGIAVDLVSSGNSWPLVAGVAAAFASVAMRGRFLQLALVFSTFLLIGTFVTGQLSLDSSDAEDPTAPILTQATSDSPAIIHIVLDAHLGLAGFPDTVEGNATRKQLEQFYRVRGFQIYERAYSRFFLTTSSLPDTLSFGAEWFSEELANDKYAAPQLPYFDALKALGYDVTVYQSSFMDICRNNSPERCETYDSTSIKSIDSTPLSAVERSALLGANFLSLSGIASRISGGYDNIAVELMHRGVRLPPSPLGKSGASSIASLATVDRFAKMVSSSGPGKAYFYHVLLPHSPYSTNAECSLKPPALWLERFAPPEASYRQTAYLEQLQCTTLLVERIFQSLSQSEAKDNFIMILHGDHGSRIMSKEPSPALGALSLEDFKAGYSTLFAVRFSGEGPAMISQPASIGQLMGSLVTSEFNSIDIDRAEEHSYWINDYERSTAERFAVPSGFWPAKAQNETVFPE